VAWPQIWKACPELVTLQPCPRQQRSVASSHGEAGKLPAGLGSRAPLPRTPSHQLTVVPCRRGAGARRVLPSPPLAETGFVPGGTLSRPPRGDASPRGDVGSGRAALGGGCYFSGQCQKSARPGLRDSPVPFLAAALRSPVF